MHLSFGCVLETLEPDVKIVSLAIKSAERPDIVLPVPESGNPKGLWFTLKEGSRYSLLFTFQVSNNIVSGLKYTNTVWKTGVKGKHKNKAEQSHVSLSAINGFLLVFESHS